MKEWKSIFNYVPLNMKSCPEYIKPGVEKILIRNNLEGNQIRLRFSNLHGKTPMKIGKVNAGILKELEEKDHPDRVVPVTFDGCTKIEIEKGRELFSDSIELPVLPGDVIGVFIEIEEEHEITCGQTTFSNLLLRVIHEGGHSFQIVDRKPEAAFFYGLCEIQVMAEEEAVTIACFGDSITQQGHWTSELTLRLYKKYPGKVSVINCGISGNRMLHDATPSPGREGLYGEAGIKRFEKDVFDQRKIDKVLVLEGINDIIHPHDEAPPEEKVSERELIEGLFYFIKKAHDHKAEIFLCTILPFQGYKIWSKEMDEDRRSVNRWIRENKAVEGYFDFDSYARDPLSEGKLQRICDSGDGLHPSAKGGEIIAEQVYQKIIKGHLLKTDTRQ